MSEQNLRKILITLSVLVALWAVTAVVFRGDGRETSSDSGGVAAALAGVDPAEVTSVRIEGPLADLDFQRDGGEWTVNGFRADSAALDRLWEALTDSEVGRVVATNPANHERMGVSADSAWSLQVAGSGGDGPTLLIGKAGPTFPSAYARVAEDDRVVVVTGDLRAAVARGLLQWRDKTLVRTDTAAVARVVVTVKGETLTLERPDGAWMLGDEVADPIAVGNLMSELNRMVATGFVEDEGEGAARGDPRSVTAFDSNGETLASVELSGEGGTRHARVPDSDIVWEIPVWRVDRIAPDRQTLMPTDDAGG